VGGQNFPILRNVSTNSLAHQPTSGTRQKHSLDLIGEPLSKNSIQNLPTLASGDHRFLEQNREEKLAMW
jgi:hypothetical protein